MLTRTAALAALGLALALGAFAPEAPAAKKASNDDNASLAAGEARFLRKAAADGMAEAQLGRIAQERALRDEVRQYGHRMAEDHDRANLALQKLAAAKGVALPDGPEDEHREEAERLSKLVGPEFDRAYMKRMVDAHESDVREFRRMAKSAKDADVKRFAAEKLATLQSHLRAALATRDVTLAAKRTGERETGSTKP